VQCAPNHSFALLPSQWLEQAEAQEDVDEYAFDAQQDRPEHI
jgi:hypothetical protein